jgi:hypothetical protein
MTEKKLKNIIDPMTAKISCSLPGNTIKLPEGMKTVPAETPERFQFRPVK